MPRANGTELRQAILAEARRVLLEHGYTDLSMRRIAKAVGCTATSIYLYFRSKDELFHTLIDEGMDRLGVALRSSIEGVSNPVQRVERLCRSYLEFGLENPEFYEIMFLLHPMHMERYPAEKYRRARANLDVFLDALVEAVGRPLSAAEDLRVPATVLWSSLHGTISLLIAQRIDVRIDRKELMDQAVAHATSMVSGLRQAERIQQST